jgi:uncharacterized membrane protein YebE (DUF533 family)
MVNTPRLGESFVIDADKIIRALQTDPQATLRQWGQQAQSMGGDLIERLKTDPNARNVAIAGAGGVLAGMIAGRANPRFTGALTKVGGLAALGGLAYYAWRRHEARKAGQAPQPAQDAYAPPPAGFLGPPGDPAALQKAAKLTLMAMINAAKADGKIDTEEKARLFDRLGQVSLSDDEKAFLFEELARPMDTDRLVAAADTPPLRAHVYAASLTGINPDHPAERAYLAELARRLELDPALVQDMHAAA